MSVAPKFPFIALRCLQCQCVSTQVHMACCYFLSTARVRAYHCSPRSNQMSKRQGQQYLRPFNQKQGTRSPRQTILNGYPKPMINRIVNGQYFDFKFWSLRAKNVGIATVFGLVIHSANLSRNWNSFYKTGIWLRSRDKSTVLAWNSQFESLQAFFAKYLLLTL